MPREITYNWLDRPAELTAQEALFVSRLKANEDAAYDELVRTYSGPIYHVAYRMTGDAADASDAVQDIFLKIFRNIGGFKGEAALKTWIFKIAFSEILNRLRWWKRRHRYATLSLDESPNGNTPGDGVADAGPTPEEVLQAKEREYRRVFLYRDRGRVGNFDGNRQIQAGAGSRRFEEVADALFIGAVSLRFCNA